LAAWERVICRQLRLKRRRNCSSLPQPRLLWWRRATAAASAAWLDRDLSRPARRFSMEERRLGILAL